MFHCLSLFGLLLTSTAPPAAVPPASQIVSRVEAAGEERAEAGLRVAVDPATGRIIAEPTEADLRALATDLRVERRRSAWDLESFKLDRGGEGVFLDGWAEHSLVVRRDSEGRLHPACAAGDDHEPEGSEAEENLR